MIKEIEANLCLAIVGKNSKIQNGRHFLDTPWVENFDEIALSRMVKEIEANSTGLPASVKAIGRYKLCNRLV